MPLTRFIIKSDKVKIAAKLSMGDINHPAMIRNPETNCGG